jgi:hypothetical protein
MDMNPEMTHQLAQQRVSELRQEAASCQLTVAAARELHTSIKERAGWALITAGLRLTGPPSPRQHARPRPAGL